MNRSGDQRLTPGDVVGDFLVGAVVAQGGTTTTFRATSQTLERPVTFKYFHPETFVGDDGTSVDEARRAAADVARLEHPAIAPVFAAGEFGGGLYVASAETTGDTIATAMEARSLTPDAVAAIVEAVAGALEHAHAGGIVHRDLRPECVMLGRWGNASVRDFGVTRASGRTGLLTRADVMASLRYTAPEVILGRPATPKTDTYGLAAIAVAALTAAPPYEDRPPGQYVLMRTSAPPPVLRERDGAPATGLSAVIARGMALEPADRPSPSEFAADLAAAIAALPPAIRQAAVPFEARELTDGEPAPTAPAPQPADEVALAAPPAAPALHAGDVTRIEQRRPVAVRAAADSRRISWQTWVSVAGFALTVGVLAALIAFLTAPGTPPAVRVGALTVTPPDGWTPDRGGAPTLRTTRGGVATLAVAPARLPGAPLTQGVVGRTAPARARAGDGQVVIYDGGGEVIVAAPTTKGTLYARCSPQVGVGRCAALVTRDVVGGKALTVTPDARASDALRTAMADVQQQGGVALAEMTGKRAADRAGGASALAGTLRNAAGSLIVDGVDPGTAAALQQASKALAAEAGALEQYASALDRKSTSGQAAARAAASAASARLQAALDRFKAAGYRVEG